MVFLGGGSSGAASIAAAPVPTPAPPVEPTNQASLQAEHDVAVQNLLKKTTAKTRLAGDSMYVPGGNNPAGQAPAPTSYRSGKLGG